ncbi:hypothetical protein CFN78_22465 [Amycolatopsis antarctica]|uniref:Peptidase C39-like domain-containing protein n=1 Tax=Amycolatopsis antarctica TaxID=1854586 RepID=A0A263D070_9PSEU|nr:hypothetical protein CFN78_22465 [Amycolatopsis antarctica]
MSECQAPRRAIRRVAATLALAAAATLGVTGTASAATATVGDTDGDGLSVRQQATSESGSLGPVRDGDTVDIGCQEQGQPVTNTNGWSSDLWDYVPALGGYLADAYLDTGHDGRIPGVPDCGDGGGIDDLVPVSQFQGQPNQGEDCGPTSVVTALLAHGVTPRGWGASQVSAINQARADMGYDPGYQDPDVFGTVETDVVEALAANDVSSTVIRDDLDAILARVRAGSPAVLAGNTKDLPWSTGVVPHFLTVAAHENGEYLVLDPAAAGQVHRASASTLLAYFQNEYGYAGVVLG